MNSGSFFREFLRVPRSVGAVLPSSRGLARLIVDCAGVGSASVIVEYGPGTGVFTREIARRARPGATFISIEMNERMAAALSDTIPNVSVVNDSVAELGRILKAHNAEKIDAIVSGLPWAAFPPGLQDDLLRVTCEHLAPGGTFCTFAYLQGLLLPAGKRFREKLDTLFAEVNSSKVVWRNAPPAFVYCCRKSKKQREQAS